MHYMCGDEPCGFLGVSWNHLTSPFLSSPHDNRTPAVGGDFWSILPGVTAHICLTIGMVV